jgi:hypothetical protein
MKDLKAVLEDANMGTVIGPVLRRADGYSFDTWTAGKGVTRGYPYRRIEDALRAECRDQGVCAGSRPGRDRVPDPRRVHREIHRVRDACRRLTRLARQSRHLAGRCPDDESRQISSVAALLAAGGTQSAGQSAWARDVLACADEPII